MTNKSYFERLHTLYNINMVALKSSDGFAVCFRYEAFMTERVHGKTLLDIFTLQHIDGDNGNCICSFVAFPKTCKRLEVKAAMNKAAFRFPVRNGTWYQFEDDVAAYFHGEATGHRINRNGDIVTVTDKPDVISEHYIIECKGNNGIMGGRYSAKK